MKVMKLFRQRSFTSRIWPSPESALKVGALGPARPAHAEAAPQLPSLDGIRALSVTIVFMSHAGLSQIIPGGFGVTVFFFLSGFLITTLMIGEFERHGRIAIGAFYARRALRLGPPLLVTIAAAALAVALGLAAGDLDAAAVLSQLFFYHNYFILYNDATSAEGLDVVWSLSVEEHFYLIWPFAFMLLVRSDSRVFVVCLILLTILLWRIVRYHAFGASEWIIYVSTDTRFDSILYGCLLALISGSRGAAAFPTDARRHLIILASLLAILSTFLIRDEAFRSTYRYTIQGLALMPLFYYAVFSQKDIVFLPLNWSLFKIIGVYSYSIYLSHFAIIKILLYNDIGGLGSAQLVVGAGILSILFAAAVHAIVERPLLPVRKRITGHR